MIVLDTSVILEALKPRPAETVLSWLKAQKPETMYTTAIAVGEILSGIQALPAGQHRLRLTAVMEQMFAEEFPGRILPFDLEAGRTFSRIVAERESVGRPISQFDAMIAAVARSHRAPVATGTPGAFEGCGVRVVNPWKG